MPRHNPPLVAIVDIEATFLRLLRLTLESEGYQTVVCDSGVLAHDKIVETQPDLVVLDTWLENRDAGWDLLQSIWLDEKTCDLPIVICSSDRDSIEQRAPQIKGKRRVSVVIKPFHPDVLIVEVRRLLEEG